jgi:hypothetical protein
MNAAWLVAGIIRQVAPAASPAWNPAIVGGLAALLLLAIIGYVIWYLRREREQRYWVADMPTEIATSVGAGTRRGGGLAIAYLIAEDESLRLPKRIALEAAGEIRFGRDRGSCQVVLDDIAKAISFCRMKIAGAAPTIRANGSSRKSKCSSITATV